MMAKTVVQYGKWSERKFSSKVIREIPNKNGIYIIRATKAFCRVRGQSDIIYIGINKKQRKDGLQGRIRQHINQKSSAGKYLDELSEKFYLKIAYKTENHEKRRCRWESEQLKKYLRSHLELPPANSSLPKE